VSAWIAEAIDSDRHARAGRGWKNDLLGGASVHKIMSTIPRATEYHFRVSTEEAIIISRALGRSGLNRNAFIRRALAHWLITREGVDPLLIPKLGKDL
jgi:hypothetical protein